MLDYIFPRIAIRDLPPMFAVAAGGAIIAGTYGALHDQITYTISAEYYTKLKFIQFGYADVESSDRFLAARLGFRATCWVGLFAAWFLARRLIPGQSRYLATRQLSIGFGIVIVCALFALIAGLGYGMWRGPNADYAYWQPLLDELHIEDRWHFVLVAYIHSAGYIGSFVGFLVALLFVRPYRASIIDEKPQQ